MHRFKMKKIVHCVQECGHTNKMKTDLSTAPLGREADTYIYLSNDIHVCELPQTYSNELPYEYMLALRTTALIQADRKSL